jgi:hypothetical protein
MYILPYLRKFSLHVKAYSNTPYFNSFLGKMKAQKLQEQNQSNLSISTSVKLVSQLSTL